MRFPRAAWSIIRWWLLLSLATLATMFIMLALNAGGLGSRSVFYWMGFAIGPLFLVGHLVLSRRMERLRKRLHAADWRLCTQCGQSLEGLAASGTCPECGRAYTVEQLRADWSRLFRR
jgi:predicted RNA-binding Zn-ribbon protein involved in translation (DUF1610 family)